MEIASNAAPATWNAERKLAGGYRRMSTRQICLAWSAYKLKVLRKFMDFRAYLALNEIAERQAAAERVCRLRGHTRLQCSLARGELTERVGRLVKSSSLRCVRASLRRLERAGLVRLSSTGIVFEGGHGRITSEVVVAADEMLCAIDDRPSVRERTVPIPRRTLRFLAASTRPVLAATMLGQMMRCLWWREGQCRTIGSCSTMFIVGVFDVHERNVKRAREFLRETGWLRPVEAAGWHVNANGARGSINMAWGGVENELAVFPIAAENTDSPPPSRRTDTESPPPIDKHNLPSGSKNHNPAFSRTVGVRKRTRIQANTELRRVQFRDLRDAARLDSLFEQWVGEGLLQASSAERVRFFAAAEHALRVGTRNPCGLFVAVVRRGLWSYVSQGDEDRAVQRLRTRGWHDPILDRTHYANPSSRAAMEGSLRECSGHRDSITELVRELASLRSLDSVFCGRRNRPWGDDGRMAAA